MATAAVRYGVLLAALGGLSVPGARGQACGGDVRERYLELVDRYGAAFEYGAGADRLAGWPVACAKAAVAAMLAPPSTLAQVSPETAGCSSQTTELMGDSNRYAKAALLHTEVAARLRDPEEILTCGEHLALARKCLDAMCESPAKRGFICDWLVAVGRQWLQAGWVGFAAAYADAAVAMAPDHVRALLASGNAYETAALTSYGVDLNEFKVYRKRLDGAFRAAWPAVSWSGYDGVPKDWLARAAERYRAAAKLEPKRAEAHLRLGHALGQMGRLEEARRELALAAQLGLDPREQSLAHLFLGELEEHEGRLPKAVEQYRAAVQARPRSQTAQVALSALLLRTGDRTGAMEADRGALSTQHDDAGDWVAYLFSEPALYGQVLNALRRQVRQ